MSNNQQEDSMDKANRFRGTLTERGAEQLGYITGPVEYEVAEDEHGPYARNVYRASDGKRIGGILSLGPGGILPADEQEAS